MNDFSRQFGMEVKAEANLDEVPYYIAVNNTKREGNVYMAAWDYTRHQASTLGEVEQGKMAHHPDYPKGVNRESYVAFVAEYEAWKGREGLLFFPPLLVRGLSPPPLGVQLAVVDEAQD